MLTDIAKRILESCKKDDIDTFMGVYADEMFCVTDDYAPEDEITDAEFDIIQDLHYHIELVDCLAKTRDELDDPAYYTKDDVRQKIKDVRFIKRLEELERTQVLDEQYYYSTHRILQKIKPPES